MQPPKLPENEFERLVALHALNILDTPPEERFDRITRLATKLLDVPISLVTLIDKDRQWFKSCQGIEIEETPRAISFCGHTILQNDVFILPDTRLDPRFADNPLVVDEPYVVFYAGCPVTTLDGSRIGTLCIVDHKPRQLSDEQVETLRDLASLLKTELNLIETDSLQKTAEEIKSQIAHQRRISNFITDVSAVLRIDHTRTLSQMLQHCSEAMVSHLDAALARIWVLRDLDNGLDLQASAGFEIDVDNAHRQRPAARIDIETFAQDPTPYLTNDLQNDLKVVDKGWVKQEGLVAFVGYPLMIEEKLVGVMTLYSRHHLDETTLQAMEVISNMIAVFIERYQAELKLAQTSAVVENNPAVLFRWRATDAWPVLHVSENIQRFGYTPEELLSGVVPYLSIVHPDDVERVLHETTYYSRPTINEFTQEYRIITKGGDIRWTDNRTMIERDDHGNITHYQGIVLDITERKQAEDAVAMALAETEMLYQISQKMLAAQTPAELTASVVEGIAIPAINRAVLVSFVYDQTEAVELLVVAGNWYSGQGPEPTPTDTIYARQQLNIFDLYFTDRPLFFDNIQTYEGADLATLELTQRQGIQAMAILPLWSQTRQVGVLLLQGENSYQFTEHEIRPYRAILNQLGIAWENQLLLEQTQQRAIELAKAKDKAEFANQTKGEFLSKMSHELRTPLNGILGYAQILKQGDDSLTAKQTNGLNIIERSGRHLLTLINDVFDMAKIEANKIELNPHFLYLSTFLNDIIALMSLRAEVKGLVFETNIPDTLPSMIYVDEVRLRQVLINLIGNAIKFTNKGSVTVTIDDIAPPSSIGQNGRRTADLNSEQTTLRFTIQDTGIGLADEQLNVIFAPFVQVGTFAQHREGTGLGLAISQQLVNQMGSEIQVASKSGEGSTFWFELTLPIQNTDSAPASPQLQKQIIGYTPPQRTILAADDNTDNQLVLHDILESVGFNLIMVKDGQALVDEAQQKIPDLILTDLLMPKMSGMDAARQLRQLPDYQTLPIIAISADANQDEVELAEIGFDEFIVKPIQLDILFTILQQKLDLVWLYAEDGDAAIAGATEPDEKTWVVPPDDLLTPLYTLVRSGKLHRVAQEAETLIDADATYTPFAQKLIQLAQEFDREATLALLEQYIER